MRSPRPIVVLSTAVAIAFVCAACTPLVAGSVLDPGPSDSPSPTPSPTAAAEPEPSVSAIPIPEDPPAEPTLFISADGIGDLRIDEPAASSSLVTLDPDYCIAEEDSPASYTEPERWISTIPRLDDGRHALRVNVGYDGLVDDIEIVSPDLATAEGIHIGSTSAELRAAYPGVRVDPNGGASTSYMLDGARSTLIFEVITDASYMPEEFDTVYGIRILWPESAWFGIGVGTDSLIGGCPFSDG